MRWGHINIDTGDNMHDIYTMDNNFKHDIPKVVSVPMELYESLLGNYFIGYADALNFGEYTGAWARLYNPPYSNVNLYVNVWTVSDISESTYQADIWFNATPSGIPRDSMFVTPFQYDNSAACKAYR